MRPVSHILTPCPLFITVNGCLTLICLGNLLFPEIKKLADPKVDFLIKMKCWELCRGAGDFSCLVDKGS